MSRQVGAAIVSDGRELISIGWNDVPKFGGGLYSEDDQAVYDEQKKSIEDKDHRCFKWGMKICHNEVRRNGMTMWPKKYWIQNSNQRSVALCGACTVHLDNRPIRSCITPVSNVVGKKITTIEAIGQTESGAKVQRAWLNIEVVQCGYCQSGQIMSAAALLESNPNPTDADIDAAMSGNICRCGTYPRIRAAIKQASQSA
jgi:isoquinoline 1-oxidoreductase alpha subunit